MSVWLCLPSARPPADVLRWLELWQQRGYSVALWRDRDDELVTHASGVKFLIGEYPGYSLAVNRLVASVLSVDTACDWLVVAGDDTEPDPNHSAEEIAQQCSQYFDILDRYNGAKARGSINASHQQTLEKQAEIAQFVLLHHDRWSEELGKCPVSTFGVMQPTGDRWGENARSIAQYGPDRAAYADRVCGSPWIGKEFALRINQGHGPLWPEYTHMFEDEELFEVATHLGVLWQRRDLTHKHNHWARERGRAEDMPAFLKEVSGPEHWRKYKALFDERKALGFPESEPL